MKNGESLVKKLGLGSDFWPILALDHGLTVGHSDSVPISLIPKLLKGCRESIGSAVMTYGLAKFTVPSNVKTPLIIQCFGSPSDYPKFKVCSIEQALELNASGVAVQVNFNLNRKKLSKQLKEVASLTQEAHKAELPVLFMVTPELNNIEELSHSIRFCVELGADLIKVRCNTLKLDEKEKNELKLLLKPYPPVLLSGGNINDNILSQVAVAKAVGFSGYCIGRNIFQNKTPIKMAQLLHDKWNND